jgi:hypothetical protein
VELSKLAVACSLAMTLVACGGGGGGAGSGSGSTTDATVRTLDGVAAKGLIKNGVVKVYAYGANGIKSASSLVESRTSSVDGSYSVSLGSNIGLFTVEVSADAATTMNDEFLGDIAMPVGMTLRSLVQLDSTAATIIKGYVTPFSDMLVSAAAGATGGLTSANVSLAQSGVIKLLGFNPLTTKPFNINSDAASKSTDASEKLQSVLLAAISKIANDSTNNFGCSGSVSEKVKCVVDATTGSVVMTGGNLSIALQAQLATRAAAESVVANKTINKTALASLDGVSGFSQASVTTDTAIVSPVAAAKAFFASIRTNLSALLNAQKTGTLNLQVIVLQNDFSAATAPLDQDLADWILITERGVNYFNDYKSGVVRSSSVAINANGAYSTSSPMYSYSRYIGSCAIYADELAETVLATSPANAKSVFCSLGTKPVAGTFKTTSVADQFIQDFFTKTVILVPVAGSTSDFTYESRTRISTRQTTYSFSPVFNADVVTLKTTTLGSYAGTTDRNTRARGTVSYAMSGNVLASATVKGFMPARTDASGVALTDQEEWNISYARTPESTTVNKYALSGKITALKNGVSIGSVGLQEGTYIRVTSAPDDTYTHQDIKEVNLIVAVTGLSSSVSGTLSLNNFSFDGSGSSYAPTDVKFVGSFSNAGAEFFKGTLTAKSLNYTQYQSSLPDSASNFLQTSASFVGVVKIPSRPDVSVSLAGGLSTSRTDFFTGEFNDGTNAILISRTAAAPAVTNLSSSNGLSMVLNDGVNVTDVFKNSSKIATYTRSSGVINYSDGSIETVK